VGCDEPFKKLICQGMVLKDGSKMSKSKGNTVDPDEMIDEYGADALRAFMAFAAPIEKEIDWTGFEGIEGAARFLRRVARMVGDFCAFCPPNGSAGDCAGTAPLPAKPQLNDDEKKMMHKLNAAIKHITDDLETRHQFNTVVSSLMELSNDISALPKDAPSRHSLMRHALPIFAKLLSPVAPHLAEQLWVQLGGEGFCMHAPWPAYGADWLESDEQLVVVQINGKVRGRVTVSAKASIEERKAAALACAEAQPHLVGKEVIKVIVPPGGKLVSVVVGRG
jgi:leucyl-tRNA synthetase